MSEHQPVEAVILYADDTEAQRYAISHVLRRAGFEVVEATTGNEALQLLQHRPDLVVLDVNLPDISGYEVCRRIKSSEGGSRLPVLHVSATLVTTQARVAGLEGGADGYLVQPVEPEELIATIRALLRVRKSEEDLWVSKQQYREFFEANPLACLVVDAANLRILAVNRAAVDHLGYSRDEFMSMTVQQLATDDQRSAFAEFLQSESASFHTGKHWNQLTKSGKTFASEVISAPLQLNARNVRMIIVQDITEKLKRHAAEQKQELRRLLLERVLLAQEEERERIARDLHDDAGQLLTSLLVGLRTISDARKLGQAKEQAHKLREIASKAISELGRMARGLHSTILDDLGFQQAVERHAEEFSASHDIEVKLDFGDAPLSALPREQQISLYRIIQEALTNVARHSRASHVCISFARNGGDFSVLIADDGCGLSVSSAQYPSKHLGIEGMRQRAAMLGGSLELISEPQRGVSVQVRFPLSVSLKRTAGGNH